LNTLTGTPEELAKIWEEEGVHFFPRQFDWVKGELVFELKSHPPLTSLPSFQKGWFYIQDPSTLLAPSLLGPQPGEDVMDMCAAPGGKTTFMAQLMENRGTIVALEPHIARREMVRRNCGRLGVTCVKISPEPGTEPNDKLYDRILIDAPCSNSGVIRRRVDLRWRIQPQEIARLRQTQEQLLNEAAKQLRKGGTLAYSTCSLELEENQEVIQSFLAREQSFKLEKERALLPFADGVDGAYVALLEKAS
jgi:16S rRNA (cytosine967-C5)-methyltransferase